MFSDWSEITNSVIILKKEHLDNSSLFSQHFHILRYEQSLCSVHVNTARDVLTHSDRFSRHTDQQPTSYLLHPTSWGCPGASQPPQRRCSGWLRDHPKPQITDGKEASESLQ